MTHSEVFLKFFDFFNFYTWFAKAQEVGWEAAGLCWVGYVQKCDSPIIPKLRLYFCTNLPIDVICIIIQVELGVCKDQRYNALKDKGFYQELIWCKVILQ